MKCMPLLCCLSLAACAGESAPQTPDAIVAPRAWAASTEVQAALRSAEDRRFVDLTGAFGGSELFVRTGYSVNANPISGRGPHAVLVLSGRENEPQPEGEEQGTDGFYWVPFGDDADCADFLQRVGIEPNFKSASHRTELYCETLGLR